nr:hypothetical protein [Tanacetum cinerariifolium]
YTTYLPLYRYARMRIQQRLAQDLPCNTECRGDYCRSHMSPSRWKELSKETSSKILPCGDGTYWKTFKLIASLIAKGKLK